MAKQFLSAISCYPGAVGSPGLYLGSDTSTGFYRIGANNIGVAISGSKVLDIASTGLSVTGQVTSTSLYISGNLTLSQGTGSTSNNLKLKGQGAGAQGISFYDYTDVWQGQLYMAASSYGFLNSNWGGWDLSKTVNGQLTLTVSSVSQTVLHTGNYNSYSPTLTGTGASGTWGISITGNAATVTDLSTHISSDPINPTNVTTNHIGYANSVSLFGQTDGGLYNASYDSANWHHQIFGDFRSGRIAIRGKSSGTWQPWRTVLDAHPTTQTVGSFDQGTSSPVSTTRLNYDGYLYATRFYGDGSQLTGVTTAPSGDIYAFAAAYG